MTDFKNSDMRTVINEYVHNHRYRGVLIDHICDGYTFEQTAERNDFSVRQTKNIVYRYGDRLFLLLNKGDG